MKALLLFLALVMMCATVAARDSRSLPEAYGQAFLQPGSLIKPQQRLLLSAPEGGAYLERVQQEEWRAGPYGAGLSETLLDAANYFESRGDVGQVVTLLRRSVHLMRVNDGLYTPLQLPQLQRLQQFYLQAGELVDADETQSWLYHLARENYARRSGEYVTAVLVWADWRRRRWMQDPDPDNPNRLHDVWRTLEDLLPDDEEPPLAPQLYGKVINAQIDLLYTIGSSYFGLDREAEMMLGRGFAREQSQGDVAKSQMQHLQTAAYSRGRKKLESLIAVQTEAADLAASWTRLADWHLWYGKYSAAGEAYREAWNVLGSQQQRQQYFGRPLELPVGEVLYSGLPAADLDEDPVKILANFRVSKRGKVEKAEASVMGEEEGPRYRLLRKLRAARFRPRLEAGEMVATENVQRTYITGF